MKHFRYQLLLSDITWIMRYNLSKNIRYRNLSTDCTFVSLNFTIGNFGNTSFFDETDRVVADTCFSKTS